MDQNKANYGSISIYDLKQLDDPDFMLRAIDSTLLWANGYTLQGMSREIDQYLKDNFMAILTKVAKYREERDAKQVKVHPNVFYLVPWSVGYQCFVKKPTGFSIKVVAVPE